MAIRDLELLDRLADRGLFISMQQLGRGLVEREDEMRKLNAVDACA